MEKKANELDKIPNGVFFIEDFTTDKTECRNYIQLTDDTVAAPPATKYIGVKMGDKAIAVALRDLPRGKYNDHDLLPLEHKSPAVSEHYCRRKDDSGFRFNAFEDFDGKGNTERLKSHGCKIPIPRGEWIPAMGELGIIMMNLTAVNKALKLAGGQTLRGWCWSSTEYSQYSAWHTHFSSGYTTYDAKYAEKPIRTVSKF